jgi:hypothetical protein
VTGSDAKFFVAPKYGDGVTDEVCIAATVVEDVVVVCSLLVDVPSPEDSGLLDLFLSKGILL